jgi:Sulfate permease family
MDTGGGYEIPRDSCRGPVGPTAAATTIRACRTSSLKERGWSSPVVGLDVVRWQALGACGCTGPRRRGQGVAVGRLQSGRRALTPAPSDARCSAPRKDECSLLLGARGRGPAPARRRRKQPGLGAGRQARLACAACFLLAWVAQLGWLAHYFSRRVLVGYIHGVAVVLVCGQLGKLLGVDIDATKPIGQLVDAIQELGNASGTTVIVSAIALGALLVARFFLPRLPAALIVVLASILVSWAVDLEAHGVAVSARSPPACRASASRGRHSATRSTSSRQ